MVPGSGGSGGSRPPRGVAPSSAPLPLGAPLWSTESGVPPGGAARLVRGARPDGDPLTGAIGRSCCSVGAAAPCLSSSCGRAGRDGLTSSAPLGCSVVARLPRNDCCQPANAACQLVNWSPSQALLPPRSTATCSIIAPMPATWRPIASALARSLSTCLSRASALVRSSSTCVSRESSRFCISLRRLLLALVVAATLSAPVPCAPAVIWRTTLCSCLLSFFSRRLRQAVA